MCPGPCHEEPRGGAGGRRAVRAHNAADWVRSIIWCCICLCLGFGAGWRVGRAIGLV